MAKHTIFNSMNKRGFIDGFSLVVFLVVILSVGGATYVITQEGNQIDITNSFVGDTSNNIVYNSNCIENILRENVVIFPDLASAESLNYTFGTCEDG